MAPILNVKVSLELAMSYPGRASIAVVLVILGLLHCLPNARCDTSFLSRVEVAMQPSAPIAPGSVGHAASIPCDDSAIPHANISGVNRCRPGRHSMQTNLSLHISYLHKQVSRSVRFPGSNEGRHLKTLQDYVYVRDNPQEDALAGDALDASIGGDVYSFGANEVIFSPFLIARCVSKLQ